MEIAAALLEILPYSFLQTPGDAFLGEERVHSSVAVDEEEEQQVMVPTDVLKNVASTVVTASKIRHSNYWRLQLKQSTQLLKRKLGA